MSYCNRFSTTLTVPRFSSDTLSEKANPLFDGKIALHISIYDSFECDIVSYNTESYQMTF